MTHIKNNMKEKFKEHQLEFTGSTIRSTLDYANCNLNSSNTNVGCAQFGGNYSNGANAGLFYVNLNYNNPLSNSNSNYGASLSLMVEPNLIGKKKGTSFRTKFSKWTTNHSSISLPLGKN